MAQQTRRPYTMLNKIRKSKLTKAVSMLLLTGLLTELINPLQAYALTSGPSQPEAESFTQADASNLVSPANGDFSYNIPLMEIGGYPINLSYQSGITMDQEASWAGLGWNVNIGTITRQMRGIPDEFWEDKIVRELNMKDNITIGANVGISGEAFGFELPGGGQAGMSFGMDISYNNYRGFNLGSSFAPSLGTKKGAAFPTNFSLGMSSSLDGMNISPNLSFSGDISKKGDNNLKGSLGFGLNMNSRTGLSNFTLSGSTSFENNLTKKNDEGKVVSAGTGKGSASAFGSSISFAGKTYTPQIDLPFESGAFTGTFKIGGAAWGGDFDIKVGGYGSIQRLKQKKISTPAYGYFYEEKANGKDDAIMDFNREKDGSFTDFTPALPLTVHTYDLFSIDAHGLSGSFRGFRNDLGFVHDNRMKTTSFDFTTSFELNSGGVLDAGFDIATNTVLSESKAWRDQNKIEPYLLAQENKPNQIRENLHLKVTGEQAALIDPTYENRTGNNKATQIPFDPATSGFGAKLDNRLKHSGGSHTLTQPVYREKRESRNVSISYLTVKDAKNVSPRRTKYISKYAKDHHIAEITVVHPDGKRYVFGLAAYNITQKEVTFNVGSDKNGNGGVMGTGPANTTYLWGAELANIATLASTNNNAGVDHYFDATTTPAFAHTWFLTEVYSADYVDLTGDGPSMDDLGNYAVFNYGQKGAGGKIEPDIPEYKWRTPGMTNSASYNKGLYSDPTDDKANYIYGIKEVYYLHTIESKNQVAFFQLKDRQDAFGVLGEFGTHGGPTLKALEKIVLYSREEYESGLSPIKAVHFEHDYSLCNGIPNGNEGKLTLRKVWFTYQNSARSKYSHYSFSYEHNAPYSLGGFIDRWGNYKVNTLTPSLIPYNSEFPYVTQNTLAQKNAVIASSKVWNLTDIGLPTGGSIHVEYEPDDYSHVQDRKAARMFMITGAAEHHDDAVINGQRLFSKTVLGVKNYNYLFFDLEEGTVNMSDQQIRDAYLPRTYSQPKTYIYYRFFANVNNGFEYSLGEEMEEYISGYAEVDMTDPHYMGKTPGGKGYIKIKSVPASDKPGGIGNLININPISKAAWQFSRIYTPKYAFNQPDPNDTEFEVVVKLLSSINLVNQMIDMLKGPNLRMLEKGFGAYFDNKRSWIRLNDPDGQKLGGGSRVKSVTISDNWNDMEASESTSSYTQEFIYRNQDGTSSGVAAYEPMVGADENPFREPVFFPGKSNLIIPADGFYQETPYGENFFPSPTIVYGRVTVRDKPVTGSSNSATGFIVHEFYTAKDYPTITSRTEVANKRKKTNPLFALLKVDMRDYMPVSQGFLIELNDMHGKPKSKKVYAETQSEDISKLISSEEYRYFDEQYDGSARRLVNTIPILTDKGRLTDATFGTEYDAVVDMREQKTRVYNVAVAVNLAYFQTGPVPSLIATGFPSFSSETTIFRSAVVTKVIQRYGVLKETIVTDLGSRISKKNKAFDPVTGSPLLVQVDSEFHDEQYSLSMPARWMYPRMGAAYQNIGFTFSMGSNVNMSTGQILPASAAFPHLQPGDELLIVRTIKRGQIPNTGSDYLFRYWVAQNNSGQKYIIDESGMPLTVSSGDYVAKVIRSGNRNMNGVMAQEVSSLVKPINSAGTMVELNASKRIIASSANTFSEQWAINHLNSVSSCTKVCSLDAYGQALVEWMNDMLAQGTLGIPNTYPLLDYLDAQDAAAIQCDNNAYIEFSIVTSSGFSKLDGLVSCGLPCQKLEFSVHGASPVQFDVFQHLDQVAYFIPGAVTDDCYGEHIPEFTSSDFITAVLKDGREVLIAGNSEGCFSKICSTVVRDCVDSNMVVNPYNKGILGNWRPSKTFAYITQRNNNVAAAADVRQGGYLNNYTSFWVIPPNITDVWAETANQTAAADFWQWSSRVTAYGVAGSDVENQSPLPAYSAAIYGYRNLLPTAVANNARYREIAFDGFEDYHLIQTAGNCYKDHFRFEGYESSVVNETAHTGKYSLKVPASTSYTVTRAISLPHSNRTDRAVPYMVKGSDLLGLYSPPTNTSAYKFVVSFWAKPATYLPDEFDFSNISLSFLVNASVVSGTLVKTKRVAGWQKFEYVFTANISTGNVSVRLNNNRAGAVYFDDLRIHPYNSNMKTYVYDINTLKTMAELDENNFATFYEYDEDGALVRIKKESEKGIITIKEDRKNTLKKSL